MVVQEIKAVLKGNTRAEWLAALSYDNLSNLPYLGMCVNEALRLDPPVAISSNFKVTEPIDICGI